MKFQIAVLPGDGIGPEVIAEGLKLLAAVGAQFGHEFACHHATVGGAAIDRTGKALDQDTLELCSRCDAVLFGAVGGPKWDDPAAKVRPEDAILGLRKELQLYANLRPVKVYGPLLDASPVKADRLKGVDLVVVRELTGGLYFGKPKKRWETSRGLRAVDTLAYSQREVDRILRVGFRLAQGRRKKLTSVDKANILETGRLWRQRAQELAAEFPDVALEHMLVDTAAMQLIRSPARFDVIVTENTFGDILT
ncbi:MAG: 3-isopropylmalate dehydrogenase, partial [Chloroflexi bacterium]|nr:3-isopropylmalate dehydrogenase [Chloroflexota bacterium]